MPDSATLEFQVLKHRYLYYVLSEPVLADSVYDQLERQAREFCTPDSPVHKVGSSNPWDYPEAVKAAAMKEVNA